MKLKKIAALVLAAVMAVVTVTGCSSSEPAPEPQEEKTEEEHTKATLAQMQPSASDTDTTEEEKENARRLHALKMLEKYYIYLNEDDLRCLEAMLQDCKRRKMEYGALDCGSTI